MLVLCERLPEIARSLVAFANTDGGRLLIGVKDNGSIAECGLTRNITWLRRPLKFIRSLKSRFSVKQHLVKGKPC
jgi:predicted HTH transcriptional regulator